MDFFVYILLCNDGKFYIGQTNDIERRLSEHINGLCSYTMNRLPIECVFVGACQTRKSAFALEFKLKKWSHAKKRAFIDKNWNNLSVLSKKDFTK